MGSVTDSGATLTLSVGRKPWVWASKVAAYGAAEGAAAPGSPGRVPEALFFCVAEVETSRVARLVAAGETLSCPVQGRRNRVGFDCSCSVSDSASRDG